MPHHTYLKHVSVHDLGAVCILEPALRAEDGGIVAKDAPVAVEHPRMHVDGRSAGIPLAVDVCAGWRDLARHGDADGRPHAHGFFERGLEVWELDCFVELDDL